MTESPSKPLQQSLAPATHQLTLPSYNRNPKRIICHIGPGNFHRTHQAVYLHRLLQSGAEQDWGICAIGLIPADRDLMQILQRQNYIYTVWECNGSSPERGNGGRYMRLCRRYRR